MPDYTIINQQYNSSVNKIQADVAASQAEIQAQANKAREAIKSSSPRSFTVNQKPLGTSIVTADFSNVDNNKERLKAIDAWEKQSIEQLGLASTDARSQIDEALRQAQMEQINAEQQNIQGYGQAVAEAAKERVDALKKLGNFVNVDNTIDVVGAIGAGIIDANVFKNIGIDIKQDEINRISTELQANKDANLSLKDYINPDKTLNISQAVSDGIIDVTVYNKAGYAVSQDEINRISTELQANKDATLKLKDYINPDATLNLTKAAQNGVDYKTLTDAGYKNINLPEYTNMVNSSNAIKPYLDGEGILSLTDAIRAGVSQQTLKEAGYTIEPDKYITIQTLNNYDNLALAIRDGKIDTVRKAEQLGLVTAAQVVDAQLDSADMGVEKIAMNQLKDANVITVDGSLKVTEAISAGIDGSVMRNAGYDVPQDVIDNINKSLQPITGEQALNQLKIENKIPTDSVLKDYNPVTGQVSYSSPSQAKLTITNSKGISREILQSDWDKKTDIQKLAFTLNRQPTISEYVGYKAAEEGIEPTWFETLPFFIGDALSLLEKLPTARRDSGAKYLDLKYKAIGDYGKEYPDEPFKNPFHDEVGVFTLEGFGVTAAKALLPQITAKDISGQEWLQSGISVGTLGLMGAGGKVATIGFPTLGVGSGYLVYKNQALMSTEEKAVSWLMTAAFFLPLLKGAAKSLATYSDDVKVSLAYGDATSAAKLANESLIKLADMSPEGVEYSAFRDKVYSNVSNAKTANNTLVKILQENPSSKLSQYIQNKTILDAATNAKLANENMVVALDKVKTGEALVNPHDASLAQQSIQAARLADENFINHISILDKVDPKKLLIYEKESGLKGITDSVLSINDAQKNIIKAWNKLDATYVAPSAWADGKMAIARTELQSAKNRLSVALDNYYNVMKPRVEITPRAGYADSIRNAEQHISKLIDEEAHYSKMSRESNLDSIKNEANQLVSDIQAERTYWEQTRNSLEKAKVEGLYPPEYKGETWKLVDTKAEVAISDLSAKLKIQYEEVMRLREQLKGAVSYRDINGINAKLYRALEQYNNTKAAIEVIEIASKKGIPITETVVKESTDWMNRPLSETTPTPTKEKVTSGSELTSEEFRTQLRQAMDEMRLPEPQKFDVPLRDRISVNRWGETIPEKKPLKTFNGEEVQTQMQLEEQPIQRKVFVETQQVEKPSSFKLETNKEFGITPEVTSKITGVPKMDLGVNVSTRPVALSSPMPNKGEPQPILTPAIGKSLTASSPLVIPQEWTRVSEQLKLSASQIIGIDVLSNSQINAIAQITGLNRVDVVRINKEGLLPIVINALSISPDIETKMQQVTDIKPIDIIQSEVKTGSLIKQAEQIQQQIKQSEQQQQKQQEQQQVQQQVKTKTETKVDIQTKIKNQIDIGKIKEGRGIPPFSPKGGIGGDKEEVVAGTIEYRSGKTWVILPPPYGDADKYYSSKPLAGTYKFAVGRGSARKTLQVIGGMPKEDVDIDMGWAQVHINVKGKELTMDFGGGKEAVEKHIKEEHMASGGKSAKERWMEELDKLDSLDKESFADMPVGKVTEKIRYKQFREKFTKGVKPITKAPPEMLKREWNEYSRWKGSPVRVYKVDGDYIRTFVDGDWNQGGHWKVYDYIPKNEVWIERMKDPMEDKFTLIHELPEVFGMDERGMRYTEAHANVANPIEHNARLDRRKIDTKLESMLNKVTPEFKDDEDKKLLTVKIPPIKTVIKQEVGMPSKYYLGRKLRNTSLRM